MSKTLASKAKPISDLLKAGLLFALNFIESSLTKRIEDPRLDKGLSLTLERLRQVVAALNDENADNRTQLFEILRKFVNEDLTGYVNGILEEEIEEIKDENIRAIAYFLLHNAVKLVDIYTDEDKDNAAQLKAFLNFLRYDEMTLDLIADDILDPLLERIGVSESIRDFVIELVILALKGDGSQTAELTAQLTTTLKA